MDQEKNSITTPAHLNSLSVSLVEAFSEVEVGESTKNGIKVNPLISEVAAWYEKVRNAIEYREEEVILRAAIERIMHRRLILGGSGKVVAAPLIRELIWARYFPDESIQESIIENVATTIDRYLKLRVLISHHHKIRENELNTWIYQLMSSDIAHFLSPNHKKEIMTNYLFYMFKDNIAISDAGDELRDVQVYIGIRRAFAKDDQAFLRFHLFKQFFGQLNDENVEQIAERFADGFGEIEHELKHPLSQKIYSYIKSQMPPFLILEDILLDGGESLKKLVKDKSLLKEKTLILCRKKYNSIRSKVNRAIIRSFIFILISKALIAISVEGTYDSLVYGKVIWNSILLNIAIPPILMIAASLFLKMPGTENSHKIYKRIETLLFEEKPTFGLPVVFSIAKKKRTGVFDLVFDILWFTTTFASFGFVIFVLTKLRFNIISQAVFLFFLTIVSFLIYRIYKIAHAYTISDKQGFMTPIIDFLFLPIAQIGRRLTEGFAQINIFLFILDFVIETPFKSLFSFFEQWFFFLHTKREYLD